MITIIIIFIVVFLLLKLKPKPTNKMAVSIILQILESFDIIDSTTKLDTFTQRLDFLGELANTLPATANYNKCTDAAIQAYTHKYSSRPVSPTIKLILNQPQIAVSPKFRDEAATAFFLRSCSNLENEIRTLKTVNARQRRVIQAEKLAETIIDRLKSNDRQKYIDCIRDELSRLSNLTRLYSL